MVNQRSVGYFVRIKEFAKKRIENNQCPSCGKPKEKWKRRKDWKCCSKECTKNYYKECCEVFDWNFLRLEVFKRDNHTCVKCGKQPKVRDSDRINDGMLIADHIKPIALYGDQWDINNIQTLCIECDKIKTKQDQKDIAKLRSKEKSLSKGQTQLEEIKV